MFYLNKIDLNPQTTFTRNDKNYQCNIDDIVVNFGDVFILVKPNEDFLAIHNGESKIKESEFVNHLLNSGGSYTAYYMLQGLALSKYLEARYKAFFVCRHHPFETTRRPVSYDTRSLSSRVILTIGLLL